MRISSLVRSFAPVWVLLFSIAAIGAQGSSAWAEDTKVAKNRKPPSVCVGLDQGACADKAECYWRKAILMKSGKTRRAHCRIKRSASRAAAS